MNRDYKNSFWRGLNKTTDSLIKKRVEQAILSVQNAQSPKDIPNLKKMKGYKIHYRIKVGSYRIGIAIVGDTVTFIAFGPRKDIYTFFP